MQLAYGELEIWSNLTNLLTSSKQFCLMALDVILVDTVEWICSSGSYYKGLHVCFPLSTHPHSSTCELTDLPNNYEKEVKPHIILECILFECKSRMPWTGSPSWRKSYISFRSVEEITWRCCPSVYSCWIFALIWLFSPTSSGMNPDGSSWRRTMSDERVRVVHGKRSGNGKDGDARYMCLHKEGWKTSWS